ncbi:MAG: hypothetical protein HDS64_08745 [Bacteroidales bacterium]|nr:hypothetical protein [Bacteroidales bacterium]MBD5282464.1 hypothetical protein [Bacteroides sp.]MDE6262642.1 zinc ribbon domain-containing protein [Muribaculaceae bacterium]MBD5293369.1 hypothetical protein [Bacteroides sp.]MBD5361064.1 hypothetical protein [Bacteroides sp.]
MFITYNDKGERIIYDGEALDYKCLECGNKFERLIDSGCCCPGEYWRKLRIQENPTTCPKCNSRNVERIRDRRSLLVAIAELEGRKLEEWE